MGGITGGIPLPVASYREIRFLFGGHRCLFCQTGLAVSRELLVLLYKTVLRPCQQEKHAVPAVVRAVGFHKP